MYVMDGVLLINKPSGCSSHDVCRLVKRKLKAAKVGHTGTLDPMATGVLPLCINGGTKLVQFLMFGEKEYAGSMRLGLETDTQDIEGSVLFSHDAAAVNLAALEEAFGAFRGEILQTPPMYSALKRGGVPLYRLAREGKTVEREPRRVTISELELLAFEPPDVSFRAVCSHGTYMRTLCHDIGRRLGCGAVLTRLERVRTGGFHVRDALHYDALDRLAPEDICRDYLIAPQDSLRGLSVVVVDDVMTAKLRNGLSITSYDIGQMGIPATSGGQLLKICRTDGGLVGIVRMIADYAPGLGTGDSAPACKTVRIFVR
jgi:tRNA pseudouridine55 synthase